MPRAPKVIRRPKFGKATVWPKNLKKPCSPKPCRYGIVDLRIESARADSCQLIALRLESIGENGGISTLVLFCLRLKHELGTDEAALPVDSICLRRESKDYRFAIARHSRCATAARKHLRDSGSEVWESCMT